MADPTIRLHQTIAAVCPIRGVSIGVAGNPATAAIRYADNATDPQKAAAQSALASFDWSAAAQTAWEEAQAPERTTMRQQAAQAIADIDTYLAIASPTNAQVTAQVRRLSQNMRAVIRRLVQLD